jgi:hypothetical protein
MSNVQSQFLVFIIRSSGFYDAQIACSPVYTTTRLLRSVISSYLKQCHLTCCCPKSAENIGNLALRGGAPPLAVPCTPAGCIVLLQRSGVKLAGKVSVLLWIFLNRYVTVLLFRAILFIKWTCTYISTRMPECTLSPRFQNLHQQVHISFETGRNLGPVIVWFLLVRRKV